MQTDVPLDNPIYAVVGQTFHIIMDIELWYNEHILTSYWHSASHQDFIWLAKYLFLKLYLYHILAAAIFNFRPIIFPRKNADNRNQVVSCMFVKNQNLSHYNRSSRPFVGSVQGMVRCHIRTLISHCTLLDQCSGTQACQWYRGDGEIAGVRQWSLYLKSVAQTLVPGQAGGACLWCADSDQGKPLSWDPVVQGAT